MNQNRRFFNISKIIDYLLPALVLTFGLQLLRAFIPGLAWYLKDTVGTPTLSLIPYAFGTFFLGFLAAILRRLLGDQWALRISAGGLAIFRLIEQFSADPALDFWLAIAGLGLFLNFLPIFLGHLRGSGEFAAQRWVYGIVLGLGIDTALRGIFGPRDLSAVSGIIPVIIVAVMAILVFWTLGREPKTEADVSSDISGKHAVLLMALGPYLTLQLLFFQSQGWVEEVAGLSLPLGFIIIMLGYLAAAAGSAVGFSQPRLLHPLITLVLSIYLGYAVFSADQAGGWIVLMILLGQFFLGWGWSLIAMVNTQANKKGLWRTTLAVGGSMVLFLLLSFAFYVAQDIALPFPRMAFPTTAAALLGVLVLAASMQSRSESKSAWDSTGIIAAGALVLVPLIMWVIQGSGPEPAQPAGFPIKVMTYNIHSAYNVAGSQDLEAIAEVIEDSGAAIIGMQEISRVRLMDGSADLPAWLSQRLDMSFVFQGTEEPIWGNAILSKYPILDSGWGELPLEGSLIKRGFLWAVIDVGENEPLLVIVTHLHQLVPDVDVRLAQVPVILDFWDGQAQTVLMGDLNAKPDSAEIGLIYSSGLLDAWKEAGVGDGFTDASDDPVKRIDFLWFSPDLKVTAVEVIQTQASDHMPVLAELDLVR